ncbi:hypothetical protein [Candidatus Magnetobacterium casense]|uniref:hypothetical protein n=1 Tax=Candidatus Magnetobacterium casense TaxID=1455061 RepID=UPI00058F1ACD|nr:hypothetical protein [Candidatus Magnetobacterium casensis]
MVYANKNSGVIQSFSPSGPSTVSQLKTFYNDVLKGEIEKEGLSVADRRFMLSHIHYAIGFKFNGYSDRLTDVKQENGWYILSLMPLPSSVSFGKGQSVMPVNFEIKSADDQTKEDFRNALIKQEYSKEFFHEVSSGAIKGFRKETEQLSSREQNHIVSWLSDYNQECREWENTWVPLGSHYCLPFWPYKCFDTPPSCLSVWPYTCNTDYGTYKSNIRNYSGCVPVAFTIIAEYWDRNGFPNLVGNPSDNNNTNYQDNDVRYTIDRFRYLMKTVEAGDRDASGCREAGTLSKYYRDGLYSYFIERGYHHALKSVSYINPGSWENVIDAVRGQRPLEVDISTWTKVFI